MLEWKGREREWLLDHGFKTDEGGKILIPKLKWNTLYGGDYFYADNSQAELGLIRGGRWDSTGYAGVFGSNLYSTFTWDEVESWMRKMMLQGGRHE